MQKIRPLLPILCLLVCFLSSPAQPGGGGGLVITQLLDADFNVPDKHDSTLRMRYLKTYIIRRHTGGRIWDMTSIVKPMRTEN